MYKRSLFLFPQPGLLVGVGRLMDFSGALTQANTFDSEEEADSYALQSDWLAVGDELREAIAHYGVGTEGAATR